MEIRGAVSLRHSKQMERLGVFLGLKAITYEDLDNGENYVLTREDGQELTLKVRGNRDQGGFLAIDADLEPLRGIEK